MHKRGADRLREPPIGSSMVATLVLAPEAGRHQSLTMSLRQRSGKEICDDTVAPCCSRSGMQPSQTRQPPTRVMAASSLSDRPARNRKSRAPSKWIRHGSRLPSFHPRSDLSHQRKKRPRESRPLEAESRVRMAISCPMCVPTDGGRRPWSVLPRSPWARSLGAGGQPRPEYRLSRRSSAPCRSRFSRFPRAQR